MSNKHPFLPTPAAQERINAAFLAVFSTEDAAQYDAIVARRDSGDTLTAQDELQWHILVGRQSAAFLAAATCMLQEAQNAGLVVNTTP